MHAPLGPSLRWALVVTAALNLAGAVSFLPFVRVGRAGLGLPDAPPFYHWVLAAWVFAFGVAYLHQGLSGRGNRAVLGLGAVGKASFASALVSTTWNGPAAAAAASAALPDAILAVWFLVWLKQTSTT